MEEILILIIQFLVEVIAPVLVELPFDWIARKSTSDSVFHYFFYIATFAIGGLIGGLSVWLFPHSMIHWQWLRCANLILAPLLSYTLSTRLAKARGSPYATGQARLAFMFTFGLVAIRLAYVQH